MSYFIQFFLETISDGSMTSRSKASCPWHPILSLLAPMTSHPWTTCPAMSYPQWPYVLPLLMVVRCCMMVVLSAKLFGLFYLRVLRQISTSTVTLMANEVSVSFASFSNSCPGSTVAAGRVATFTRDIYFTPISLKSSSVNWKKFWAADAATFIWLIQTKNCYLEWQNSLKTAAS